MMKVVVWSIVGWGMSSDIGIQGSSGSSLACSTALTPLPYHQYSVEDSTDAKGSVKPRYCALTTTIINIMFTATANFRRLAL